MRAYSVLSLFDVALRRYMGIVTQDTQIFATTIEANIAYGLDNYTRAELEEAAKAAHVHGFVSSFPEGYSTKVGERGVQLSGGQRQRIALARLLIRKPKVGPPTLWPQAADVGHYALALLGIDYILQLPLSVDV